MELIMRKIFKKTRLPAAIAIASILLIGLPLTACSNGAIIRDDVSVLDISAAFDAVIEGSDTLIEPGEAYLSGSIKLDANTLGDHIVKINIFGTNIDEYGIFKAASETETKRLASVLEDYLSMRNDSWMHEYLPEQYPKLRDAEVKINGLYVAYAILEKTEREAAFAKLDAMLKK